VELQIIRRNLRGSCHGVLVCLWADEGGSTSGESALHNALCALSPSPHRPPMVFVANRDRHFVNGVLYASTWGTTDKTPRSPIIWPIVLRSEEIHRMVFTFDTPIEPGTALLQIFGSINRSGYPDPSTPLYFCNTTQGTPARRCQITRSTDGQAEIQWHPNRLNSNQRIWYLSLLAQWPKLTHQKLTFYRGEWLFAVKRGRP
jgi:hypothetical protein